ncbi:MAG TPA: sulfite exporter TauE/SafE family protein [Nocardioidaceae bacterium]|nr:sulfite exporter TauE/SafE family protein [Nocardioidaceae bacterium]
MLAELTAGQWALLAVAAMTVGFAKTAISGAGAVTVVLFAWVLPARESTGVVLPVLIVGDLLAVGIYRRHADWGMLWRLFPWVAVGTVLGAVFVSYADDELMRVAIGVTLLVLSAGQLLRRSPAAGPSTGATDGSNAESRGTANGRRVLAAGAGVLAGVTTMVANAAGAVTSLYFLLSGLPILRFLGTGAWFYLLVNLFKVPFSVGLGLLTWEALLLDLTLVPAVVAGAVTGVVVIKRIDQRRFEQVTLVLVVVAAVLLLLDS